ncbi:MAG: ABC transporter permease [Gammaproteobacteria bacterium]|nr:ABC transporter permease [Gammaproteobacteria bacterium]NIR97102.1 ABC transporter permease [Gammaproteobacteria bacterium]NIT62805.1 ABC transporter permease [Gammaproteobacteria bacterium]NIV19770.1 ABC transporter permease [Gammaproteobacteria bacterium]NIX11214.1 ABC transporter permease [Gammaproteobacteria bacterium]
MRLRGLMRKEFLQIVRDPSSIAIAFLMPVVLLLLFGYGVSLDAKHVPVALVVEQPSADAASFTGAFRHSRYFEPVALPSLDAARRAVRAGRVDGIVRLREDFAARLRTPAGAPIQVLLDGVDANTARIVKGYVEGVWARWLEQRAERQGRELVTPVNLRHRVWFNAELRSRNYLVPGLVAVIMTLIGALLTAMIMAREWERGTMEALLVTPVAMGEILLGKLLPYFVLGMGGMALSVLMSVWLFEVPLRGSPLVLLAAAALFLLAALGMGLLISIVAKNQFVAGQAAIVVTFLPAFMLSGFIFDIGSMPGPIRALTYVIAARYFVSILQTVFLAGNVWSVIVPNAAALLAMATLFLGLARRKARKRLE